jgi:hypothetical protein
MSLQYTIHNGRNIIMDSMLVISRLVPSGSLGDSNHNSIFEQAKDININVVIVIYFMTDIISAGKLLISY